MSSTLAPAATNRLSSIDFVRGLVIVIMALDHTRDLLHTTSLTQNPVDLATTTPALFFTRFITHFCAPIFVFLAGTSAYLMMRAQNNPAKTRRFLLTRGLWLIFLEITIVGFGFWCDIQFRTVLFQVIFAIGAGFVLLSALSAIPAKWLGWLGLAIILLHDLLPVKIGGPEALQWLWGLVFQGGFFKFNDTHALIIGYPVVPWLGVMLLGFGFGRAFELPAQQRKSLFLLAGSAALLLFIILRRFNLYGDVKPWTPQSTQVFSILSFLNVSKYPPSLLYTCITLSAMFFLLAISENKSNRLTRTFITYGRVPMFFYLLHWYIIHASMFVIIILQGVTWDQMTFGTMHFGRPDSGVGLELPFVYLFWLCLVMAMYPLCRWYGRYKAANRQKWWLAYL